MSVLYDDVSDGPLNSQKYNSFEIYAVSIRYLCLDITTV